MSGALLDLDILFGGAPAPSEGPRTPEPSRDLRLKLAVRGWVEPVRLVGESREQAPRVLAPLARDVETAVQSRPGQWFLSVAARKQELASRSDQELRDAAREQIPGDVDDPVRQAVALALAPDKPALSSIQTPVLSSLGSVCDWLGERCNAPFGTIQIAAELAARTLDADLDRMTRQPMVGRVHQLTLAKLVRFAIAKPSTKLSAIYIHGGGGAGKTTLLAFLQRELREPNHAVRVARIDFDEPAIDPTRMVTLNLALCEQLARFVPEMAERVAMLRSIAMTQRSAELSRDGRRRVGKSSRATTPMMAAQSVLSEAASDEGSILYGAFDAAVIGGPLVIILDTAELVLARSDRIASGLVHWLSFLGAEARAHDIRLVIAGRDPPTGQDAGFATSNLIARLDHAGAKVAESIELPELDQTEAAALLRNCGIKDEAVILQAAEAVPGNPLLLRITGDALSQGDEQMREDVRQAHRDSRIDPASAHNYLMRRIVAHVSDPAARPYVLAAAYCPEITRALLEEVVIPCVDRLAAQPPRGSITATDESRALREKATRVFRALSATHWLVRPAHAADSVPFNRDVRRFALKLMAATKDGLALERDLRQGAAIFHLRRRTPADRAFALYHLAMLGQPYSLPRDREAVRVVLRDVLEELPQRLWHSLEVPGTTSGTDGFRTSSVAAPPHASSMTDDEWKRYLEGDAKRDGEGTQLVNDDQAREALDLYLNRPTGHDRRPPTFVLQALAELGEWDHRVADIDVILAEEAGVWFKAKRLSPVDLSRAYWVTRLALLQREGRLPPRHVDLLRWLSTDERGSGLSALAALITVVEATTGESIMGDRVRRNAVRTEAAGRIHLAARQLKTAGTLKLAEGHVAVPQKDWLQRVSALPGTVAVANNGKRLRALQLQLDNLHGRPMAKVNQLFSKLRDPIQVMSVALDRPGAVLLMRGLTTEFHRPLREVLLGFYGDGNTGMATRSILGPTLQQMSIRPAEMEPEAFYRRFKSNPRAWCTAFISYADRCRLLPSLCERLLDYDARGPGGRIATSFLAWDRALCRDHSSDWHQSR